MSEKNQELPPAYSALPQNYGGTNPPQNPAGYPPAPGPHGQQYPPGQYPPGPGQYPPGPGQYPPGPGQYPPGPGQYPPGPGQYPPGPYPPQPGYQQQQHQQYSNVVIHQPVMATGAVQGPPPDHMTAAILVTLCCFWPTGVIAILKANESKSALVRGDMVAAHNSARSAKNLINVSIVAGICSFIFMVIIIGVYWGLILSNSSSYYDD